jgi:hypothetical protein
MKAVMVMPQEAAIGGFPFNIAFDHPKFIFQQFFLDEAFNILSSGHSSINQYPHRTATKQS